MQAVTLDTIEAKQTEPVNAMLVEALEQAHDIVDHWGCYASDYFQQKHDLVGDKAKINAALTAANGVWQRIVFWWKGGAA